MVVSSHIGVKVICTVRRHSPHAEGGVLDLDLQLAVLELASQTFKLNF